MKKEQQTYVTSDIHFDHENIIDFCQRPFMDKEEMNNKLLVNWNDTIRPEDKVYFLGDLAFGTGSKSTDYWLSRLNGDITFIKGNHDFSKNIQFYNTYVLKYKDIQFFMAHEHWKIPGGWHEWSLYGHKHNNDAIKYPFFDKQQKRCNVSTELTDYKPINLDSIVELIEENSKSYRNSIIAKHRDDVSTW